MEPKETGQPRYPERIEELAPGRIEAVVSVMGNLDMQARLFSYVRNLRRNFPTTMAVGISLAAVIDLFAAVTSLNPVTF